MKMATRKNNILHSFPALIVLQLMLVALSDCVEIVQEPQHVAVLEGRAATMDCKVSNLDASNVVLWYRSGLILSNGTSIVGHNMDSSRYSIMVNCQLWPVQSSHLCSVHFRRSQLSVCCGQHLGWI